MQGMTDALELKDPRPILRRRPLLAQDCNILKLIQHLALLGILSLALGACQLLPTREAAPAAASSPPQLPFDEPTPNTAGLDADLVYSYLVAEVAAQRGELPLAYRHYLHAATVAQSAYAAERATRIAVYLQELGGALLAARRWVALAPNSQDARMSLALLLDRTGDRTAALAELAALLKISSALSQDGFVQIAQVLGKERGSDSLGLMRALVAAHPEDAQAQYALAMVALSGKSLDEAEQALAKALVIHPDWPQAQVLMARVQIDRGDKVAAYAGLTQALKAEPDSLLLRTARARLLVDMNDHEGALADFRRLHEQEPDNTEFLYAVGMLAMHGEHWDEARAIWQQLRNKGGDRLAEANYFLGQVEEKTGKPAVAVGLYASVTNSPLQIDAGLRLASLEAEQGKLKQARERLLHLRQLAPERAVDTYMTEASLLRKAGQGAQASALLDQAVTEQPDDLSLRYGRAMNAARADDLDTLEQDLKYILAREPDHVDALNALGYTLADRTRRYVEADAYIRRAHALQPDNPAILDSLGWVYYRLGNYEQALKYLRQAFEKLKDPDVASHLGEVLWVTGDREGARAVWRKALAASPDSAVLREVMERLE